MQSRINYTENLYTGLLIILLFFCQHVTATNPSSLNLVADSHRVLTSTKWSGLSHYGILRSDIINGICDHPWNYYKPATDTSAQPGRNAEKKIEVLPILSYDTDTGFGYGGKVFLRHLLQKRESFDLTLFNSTKGEKWYRIVISVPDFELRQATVYPFAFDITADFNKWIAYKFYGTGNNSNIEDEITYINEIIDLSMTANHGLSEQYVIQYGLRHKEMNNYNMDLRSFSQLSGSKNHVKYRSLFCSLRYDSRDSYINPKKGIVLQSEIEKSLSFSIFLLWKIWFQYYTRILSPETIFAFRSGIQSTNGPDLPLQLLIPLGGNNTLRGFPQGRFLDRSVLLMNAELRFVIYKRLAGIAGLDAGMVDKNVSGLSSQTFHSNGVIGLRYYFDTFIVRLDVGFSSETIGMYLNFGHIF